MPIEVYEMAPLGLTLSGTGLYISLSNLNSFFGIVGLFANGFCVIAYFMAIFQYSTI